MSEGSEGPRGTAAWQEQRAGIAKRNLDTQKRGRAERKSLDREVEARERAEAAREAKELEQLNARMASRRPGA